MTIVTNIPRDAVSHISSLSIFNTNLTIKLSEDGKQYSIKYEKLVPILVKAIQELEAEVQALKG